MTRHNVGFWVVEAMAEKMNVSWRTGASEYLYGQQQSHDCTLVKPMSYMNNSGSVVLQLYKQRQLKLSDALVVYDDIDIPLGQLRFRPNGGAGTHLGMRSVVQSLATTEIPRLRIGIGRSERRVPAEVFVLQEFSDDEQVIAEEAVDCAVDGIFMFMDSGIEPVMNRYNNLDLTQQQ